MVRRYWPLVLVCLAVVTEPARGVIVFRKEQDEPLRGFLVKETEVHIEVREVLPNGDTRLHTLPRTAIDQIVRAVSPDQLAALDPQAPDAYRQYAEDLAAKTEDPEARATAIQLHQIAAYLRPQEMGRSCLLGMAALARSPQEERAFRGMAFLLDPEHDATLLKAPRAQPVTSSVSDLDRRALANVLRLLRSGRAPEARVILRKPAIHAAAEAHAHILPMTDYETLATIGEEVPADLLRKVLTLELKLATVAPAAETAAPATNLSWSRTVSNQETQAVLALDLETLTEFDPRATRFVDGKWVVPKEN